MSCTKLICFVGRNEKGGFYEPWLQYEQAKTMTMNDAWSDTFDVRYEQQFLFEQAFTGNLL